MNPVVHFEIPYDDPARAAKFYTQAFGWETDWPAPHPSVVIAVEDIDVAMKTVQRAGGEVLGEPMPIPGVGRYVSFMDSEGNRVSMLQPEPRAK